MAVADMVAETEINNFSALYNCFETKALETISRTGRAGKNG